MQLYFFNIEATFIINDTEFNKKNMWIDMSFFP